MARAKEMNIASSAIFCIDQIKRYKIHEPTVARSAQGSLSRYFTISPHVIRMAPRTSITTANPASPTLLSVFWSFGATLKATIAAGSIAEMIEHAKRIHWAHLNLSYLFSRSVSSLFSLTALTCPCVGKTCLRLYLGNRIVIPNLARLSRGDRHLPVHSNI